jgi:hypothetical protein
MRGHHEGRCLKVGYRHTIGNSEAALGQFHMGRWSKAEGQRVPKFPGAESSCFPTSAEPAVAIWILGIDSRDVDAIGLSGGL